MRKTLALLFSILSIASTAQIAFERPFGDSHRTILTDVAEKPQGGYFVCGSDCNTFPCLGYVASLNNIGNTLWQIYFFTPDSDFSIDNVIALDSNAFVLQCAANKPTGYYAVPRLMTMDSTGIISDTFMVDITGVYNQTLNKGLLQGANKTFWTLTFIGTIGISNEITVVRQDSNLDTLKSLNYGAYYNSQFHSNRIGELGVRTEMDFWDSIQGVYYADVMHIYDQNGTSVFNGIYDSLPLSDDFLLRDDGGFNTFRNNTSSFDTLSINHFDNNGNWQYERNYSATCNNIIFPVLAADSGYFLMLTEHDTVLYNIANARLCKFNNLDDTLWTINVTRNFCDAVRQIAPTSDGGCVILLHTNALGDTLNYIMKIGPDGEHFFGTSIAELEENALSIFPNPTTNTFTIRSISSNKTTLIQIINPLGEIVYKEKLFGRNESVVHSHLSSGIYFVSVSDGERNVVMKLIVE